jgi:hypothetical protein
MDQPTSKVRWYQFSVRGLLLVLLIVAVFFGGRSIARRELMKEVASLRKEIQAIDVKKTAKATLAVLNTPQPTSQDLAHPPSDVLKSNKVVQLGAINETTTHAEGSGRYLDLEAGRLGWSHAVAGESGYFYFQYRGPHRLGVRETNSPEWQFAPAPLRDIEMYNGKPLNIRFLGRSSNSIRIEVGDTWLARTVDDPKTIYVVKIKSQERHEEMTISYVVLVAEE